MSYNTLKKVLKATTLKHAEKWVLTIIAVDADNEGCNICTPVRVITEVSGLQERSVKKILSQLRAKNVLVIEQPGIHHTANNYSINFGALGIKRKKEQAPSSDMADIIEATWLAYPKERRVSKKKTYTAILKAYKEISPNDLLEKTKQFSEAKKEEDPRYIPHSYRWFGQGRYNDDPSTWKDLNKEEKQEIKPYQ